MARRSEVGYSIDEVPNIVVKMQIVLLAADISNMDHRMSGERSGSDHPRFLETAMRWSRGQYDNSRQREATAEALRAAWSMYRFFKDVVKLDMNMMEREARRATWWR
jgi:hypothetical protein